jgi:hypothetical protein
VNDMEGLRRWTRGQTVMRIDERKTLRMPPHAILTCRCAVCKKTLDFRKEAMPLHAPIVCPDCLGPMVVVRVKGR